MSKGAYERCELCRKTVHMNHKCKDWNHSNCEGDPWFISVKAKQQIISLNIEALELSKKLDDINKQIKIYVEKI